jgi:hypothetical protein
MKDKVYILILNWNRWRYTTACLESVFKSTYPNYQVVVIDNGSSDGSEKHILNWARGPIASDGGPDELRGFQKPVSVVRYDMDTAEQGGVPETEKALHSTLYHNRHPLIVIQTGKNLGYAGGNNAGIRYAMRKRDCDYMWLLNNDAVAAHDALTHLVETAQSDDRIGLVGSKLLYQDMPDTLQAAGGGNITAYMGNVSLSGNQEKDTGQWDIPLELDFITGASLLIKRAVTEDIGLFDERYFMNWEDIDFSVRAGRRGYKIRYCPQSRVWHKEGGTFGRVNPATDYYFTRNGLLFTRKFYPMFLPLVPFAYMVKYSLIRMLRGQPLNFKAFCKGMLAFFKGKTGAEQNL